MTDEQVVKAIRAKWGLKDDPLLVVSLPALHAFIASSYEALGVAKGLAMLMGEPGLKARQEFDKCERTLNMHMGDLLK